MTTRREFLRTGAVGAVLLAALRFVPAAANAPVDSRKLSGEQRDLLAAVAPVLLAGALPTGDPQQAALQAVVDGVERAVAGLPPPLRDELDQLFMLLTFAPTRWLLAGVSAPWPMASPVEIADFLESWRSSWLTLLQSGYHALHELIMAAWYAQPGSWAALRYPGPPSLP